MDLNELNKVVGDEIYKLRSGKAKPERVNAVSRAGTVIVRAATVQLAAFKAFGNGAAPAAFGFIASKQKSLLNKKRA